MWRHFFKSVVCKEPILNESFILLYLCQRCSPAHIYVPVREPRCDWVFVLVILFFIIYFYVIVVTLYNTF